MLPESPNTELKLAHSANLTRYRPVPKRVIWLAAVLTSAIMVAAGPATHFLARFGWLCSRLRSDMFPP